MSEQPTKDAYKSVAANSLADRQSELVQRDAKTLTALMPETLDPDTARRQILDTHWRAAVGQSAWGIRMPDEVFERLRKSRALWFLEAAAEALAQRARSSSAAPGGGAEGRARVLRGRPAELRLQLVYAIQQLRGNVPRLYEFLRTVVAQTLETMQRMDNVRMVEAVDTAVIVLHRLPPQFAESLIELIPKLRELIEQERKPTSDWLTTCGALGDLLDVPPRRGRLLSIVYYDEVLCAMHRVWQDPERIGEGPPPADEIRVVQVQANNLAGRIADLARDSAGEEQTSDTARRVVGRLLEIAVAMGILHEMQAPARPVAPALVEELPLFARAVDSVRDLLPTAVVFDEALNVVVALPLPADSLELAYLEAVSGVVRADLQRRDRVASAFFNCGVTLLRAASKTGRTLPVLLVRMLVNALGLFWALRLQRDDVLGALRDADGLDCAVNLHGAATELRRSASVLPERVQEPFERLARALRALVESVGEGWLPSERPDVLRLRAAWEELRILPGTPPASAEADPNGLCEALVAALSRELLKDGPPTDSGDAVRWSAVIVRRSFEEILLSGDTTLITQIGTEIAGVIRRFRSRSESPRGTLSEAYADFVKEGPLVPAGIVTAKQWGELVAESRQPCKSLGEAFHMLRPPSAE